jgi:hypothetical protein
MIKKLPILLLALMSVSCGEIKPYSTFLLDAEAYVNNKKVLSNIAFLSPAQEYIVKDSQALTDYFKSNPENSKKSTYRYMADLPAGNYIIAIQIIDSSVTNMIGSYAYKQIRLDEQHLGAENVMRFALSNRRTRQNWKED